ncbi:hypothetical protein V2J09_001618 [Rumex salicifolius]
MIYLCGFPVRIARTGTYAPASLHISGRFLSLQSSKLCNMDIIVDSRLRRHVEIAKKKKESQI